MSEKIVDIPESVRNRWISLWEKLRALPKGKALLVSHDCPESKAGSALAQRIGILRGFSLHRKKSTEGVYFWLTRKEPK